MAINVDSTCQESLHGGYEMIQRELRLDIELDKEAVLKKPTAHMLTSYDLYK